MVYLRANVDFENIELMRNPKPTTKGNKMRLEDLKKQYDAMSIADLEVTARDANASQAASHKQFIGIMFYLEHTKRFKENPIYANSTFAAYVKAIYGLSFQTYERYRFAYFRYEKESDEFGAGTIMHIVNRTGREAVSDVIKDFRKEKKLNPGKMETIIEKYAKPRLKARKARPTYKDIERELIAEKKKNAELHKMLKARDEQIERLKATVRKYEAGINSLIPIVPKEGMVQRVNA